MLLLQVNFKSRVFMDIGKVSKLAKIPTSTLRYYEEKGLIKSIGRNGLRRVYADSVIEKLAIISLGRSAGLSLDEIKHMLLPHGLKVDRKLLLKKAEEFDRKIAQMTAVSNGLKHAAACPEPSHMECPKFLRLLNVAGKKWQKAKMKG